MSSPLPSSDGRPLEQLKVAELKDELRKRGLSLKGVKKDLFERLEDAIKREQAENPEANSAVGNEDVQNNSISSLDHEVSGARDDPETNEQTLQNEAHEDHDDVVNEDDTDDKATISIEIAPHDTEMHGGEPVQEQHDIINSDVIEELQVSGNFVGDAVMLHHTSDSSSQPGVVTGGQVSDIEDSSRGDGLVSQSDNLSESDGVVRASLNPDVVNDSFIPQEASQSCSNDKDVIMPIIEDTLDTDPHVSEDVGVSDKVEIVTSQRENTSNEAILPVSVNELVENESAPSIEIDRTVQPFLPNMADGNENIEVEVKMDVADAIEPVEVTPTTIEDKVDTPQKSPDSIKLAPVETELADFEKQSFETEPDEIKTVTEEGPYDRDHIASSGAFEGIYNVTKVHGESEEERSYMEVEDKKEAEAKPTEDYGEIRSAQKRRDEDDFKQQEPAKRLRRWNTGNDLKLEATMPLTMGTVKEITSPEIKQGSPVGAYKASPKVLTTTKPVSTTPKAEPETNGTKRAAPPPTRPPTTSLKIEKFVRPFTLKAAKDMLAEFGQCVDFWMDQIKTHCYITYSSVEEATAARNGVYNKQWPQSFGNLLVAEFVDPEEVKVRADGTLEKAKNVSQVSQAPSNPPAIVHKPSAPFHQLNAVPPPPPSRERLQPPQIQQKEPEPQIPTLDDLFLKTKAKPHIYYLPLTEEQVAEELSNRPASKA